MVIYDLKHLKKFALTCSSSSSEREAGEQHTNSFSLKCDEAEQLLRHVNEYSEECKLEKGLTNKTEE